MSTTQASAHVCTATAKPVTLPALTGLTDCSFNPLSNDLVLIAEAGKGSLVVSRHVSSTWAKLMPDTLGAWVGREIRHDASGTQFSREIRLVTYNHGELVEVPTC